MLRCLALILFMSFSAFAESESGPSYRPPLQSDSPMPCVNRQAITGRDLQKPKPVTVTDIQAVPGLTDNLKAFFGGHDLHEGVSFVSTLSGNRIDPSQCWSLFQPVIDIVSCNAVKPAGENKLAVQNGIMTIFVDAEPGQPQAALPLWSLCSDGKRTLRFQFLYMKKFGPIEAGPWEYTVEVTRDGPSTVSVTTAREVLTGRKKPMNSGQVKVTKFEVREPAKSAPPIERQAHASDGAHGVRASQ